MKIILYLSIPLFIFSCQTTAEKEGTVRSPYESSLNIISKEEFEIPCNTRAIEAIDENTMWFGGSNGQYGFTKDGGNTWQIDSLQHPDHESLEFRSIAVTKEAVFLLCVASPALLFKTIDEGQNWDIVYLERDSLAFYDSMAFWDDQEGIAMGDPTDGCLSVIKTIDGGNIWHKLSCDLLLATAKGEAAFAASNSNIALAGDNVWLVSGGKKARVFHSPDRGSSWEVYDTPILQGGVMTGIFSIDMFAEKHGLIFGGNWENDSINSGSKAFTDDGGKTWKPLHDGMDPGYSSCVQFISNDQEAIALCKNGMYYANDVMINWRKFSDDHYYTARATENGKCIWLGGPKKVGRFLIE